MLQKLNNHINHNFPYLKNKKILIAISGGIDSVVLTHLFYKLDYNITLAHCNFKLRENESDLDEQFIKNLSTKLNIPLFSTSFNTKNYSIENKKSTQIAARELRYHYFKTLIKKHQA